MRAGQSVKEMPYSAKRRTTEKSLNLLKRVFICVLIMVSVLGLKKIDTALTRKITSNINYLITYNYDFAGVIEKTPIADFIRENIKLDFSKNQPVISENTLTFSLPVTGGITSGFGMRMHPVYKTERQHNGIDIDAEKGAEITAVLEGTVRTVSFDREMGNVVRLEHDGGLETVYAHCDKVFVKPGDKIGQNQVIATVGDTGITSGPHLHFEVWLDGKPQDPVKFLR